jgi:uncharacterized membrane protein YeiB
MVRRRYAVYGGAFLIALMLAVSAAAKQEAVGCANYKISAPGLAVSFTAINAKGITCARADSVLRTFAKSGPTALTTYLGYTCSEQKTTTKHVESVNCRRQALTISARESQTAA